METMVSRTDQADLLIRHATVRGLEDCRRAESVAVKGNRIVAVGSDAELAGRAGPNTRVIQADGALLLPGFNDAHLHLIYGGIGLTSVDLRSVASPQEFVGRIGAFASKLAAGQWMLEGNWNHENWPGASLPTKEWIDALTLDKPVFLARCCHHMALANSAALKRADITAQTPDPDGGVIVRDPRTGEPTGVLKDRAMELVTAKIPAPSREETLRALKAASELAARYGVTSVQSMWPGSDWEACLESQRRGELKTRVSVWHPLAEWERVAQAGPAAKAGDGLVRAGGVKAFADGALGASTAWMCEPYGNSDSTGVASPEMLAYKDTLQVLLRADRAGLQVAFHAIGDRANDQVLSLFEELTRLNGPCERRLRLEHAQHLRPQDIPRFGPAGIIASVQPAHAADDGCWAETKIGRERARWSFAYRSLLDAGATLALGTDWPVALLNPLPGIAAAVTRRTKDGKHPEGWIPEQRITVAEAVRAYTWGSAYAEFAEQDKGTITPGKLADMVLLDRDIFTIDPGEIAQTKVLMTLMDGRIVYPDEVNKA